MLASAAGIDAEIVMTEAAGHAPELARGFVARGFDLVLAWGGDGTVNEVGGALVGTPTALGIIPSGSGDGLARGLRVPADARAAFAAAIRGPAQPLDVGFLGDRHFLNAAGVGFDAAMALAFNQRTQRGGLGYVSVGVSLAFGYAPVHYRLQLDNDVTEQPRFLVAFANGRDYGNGMVIAPDADPRDGWLDAVIVHDGSVLKQLWRARRLAWSPAKPTPGVERRRVKTASITAETLVCHVDGEAFETTGTIDVRIVPAAIRLSGAG